MKINNKIIEHPDHLLRVFSFTSGIVFLVFFCFFIFENTSVILDCRMALQGLRNFLVFSDHQLSFQELHNILEQLHNYKPRKGFHILFGQGTFWETLNERNFRHLCTPEGLVKDIYRGEVLFGSTSIEIPLNQVWEKGIHEKIFYGFEPQVNYAWVTAYLLMIQAQIVIVNTHMDILHLSPEIYAGEKEKIDYLKTVMDIVMAGENVRAREQIFLEFLGNPVNYLDFVEKLYFREGTFQNFMAVMDRWVDFNYKLSVPHTSGETLFSEISRFDKLQLLEDK